MCDYRSAIKTCRVISEGWRPTEEEKAKGNDNLLAEILLTCYRMVFVQWIGPVVFTAFMSQLTMVFSGSLISLLAYIGASAPPATCLMSNDLHSEPQI